MGRPFAAIIKLTPEFKPEFDFGQGQTNPDGTSRGVDLTGLEPIGKCPNPKCGGRIFENAMSYFCENAVSAARRPALSGRGKSFWRARWKKSR